MIECNVMYDSNNVIWYNINLDTRPRSKMYISYIIIYRIL